MTTTKRHMGSGLAIVALVTMAGFLGCGGGDERTPQSGTPATEGTGVIAHANAVTVTYYYLPG